MIIMLLHATPRHQGLRNSFNFHQKPFLELWQTRRLHYSRASVRGPSFLLAAMTPIKQKSIDAVEKEHTERIHVGVRTCTGTELPSSQFERASFDKSEFDVHLELLALRVPKHQSSVVSKILFGYVFDRPRLKHIVPDPANPKTRLVLLSERIRDPSLSQLPDHTLSHLRSVADIEVVEHHVLLNYNYWTVEHVLKGLLPAGCEVPSSFEAVGHIAHLNIRDELIPYKKLIASVILDKNQPKIKTIVNKIGTITNEFRVPTFEVLAGDQSLVTELKQHGARFQLDYGSVYWNTRLEYEHKRLVSQFSPQQVICDMFAGVGPFAIPAAQKGCIVYANDLNPDSVKYLRINAEINKVNNRIHTFNMDAREFMRRLLFCRSENVRKEYQLNILGKDGAFEGKEKLMERDTTIPQELPVSSAAVNPMKEAQHNETKGKSLQFMSPDLKPWEHVDHVVMNLPASALEFLDVFQGLLSKAQWKGAMPRVHCYCFMRSNEREEDVVMHAEEALNGPLQQPDVWIVRDVAPNKTMLCLSFDLPEVVGFREKTPLDCALQEFSTQDVELAMKKPRVDS